MTKIRRTKIDASYHHSKYRRAFEFHMHPPFLIMQLFAQGYANTEPLFFCKNDWVTCYFSQKSISITSKDGIKLYSDKNKFEKFVTQFENYRIRSTRFFDKLLTTKKLSKTQLISFMRLMREYWIHFQKTEFIYLDAAFDYAKTDTATKQNLEKFGAFKYAAREYANDLWYCGPKYFENILQRLAKQLGISYDVVSNCSCEQIAQLFDGKRPTTVNILDKKASQVFFKKKDTLVYLTGDKSKRFIAKFLAGSKDQTELVGTPACQGVAKGRVRLLITEEFDDFSALLKKIYLVQKGDIIVAETTTPEFTPALSKAAAIVTAQGGMMSHAAIVSREMKIPCIVGVHAATHVLHDGDFIEVDATKGRVTIIERNGKKYL